MVKAEGLIAPRARRREDWTSGQIRKALKCPKPVNAIVKAHRYERGTAWVPDRQAPVNVRLLRWIADHADILHGPIPHEIGGTVPGVWVLVPLPQHLLDALASFEAEVEDVEPEQDLEHGGDDEEAADAEPDHDGEDDGCTEPNWVSPEAKGKLGSEADNQPARNFRTPVGDKPMIGPGPKTFLE